MRIVVVYRTLIAGCIAILSTGCAGPAGIISSTEYNRAYHPATDARIRVYEVQGHDIWLYLNQTCTQAASPIHRGTWFSGTGLGFEHLLSTKHIGMPVPSKPHWKKYNEFVIKAGVPLTIEGHYGMDTMDATNLAIIDTGVVSCGPKFDTLIPKAGHDYEVYSDTYWPQRGMNDCNLHLRELKEVAGEVTAVPIAQANGAFQCNAVKK